MLEVTIARRLAALDLDLAFELDAEVLALFGPSGAGKSMTLKMIAGIESPDRGVIRSGERLLFDSASGVNLQPQRRRVGYVPQQYALFPHMTVLENIAFPLRKGMGWTAQRAGERGRELLETFGLVGLEREPPRKLSGGQQQRVALARALAGEPDIVLLDEPFAALDAPTREDLREEFRLIQQRLEIPVLFVTHDLEEAATLASRMAVIIDGRIQQLDRPRTVLDHPVNRRVAELVRARNIISGTVKKSGNDARIETPLGSIHIAQPDYDDDTGVDVVIRPEMIRLNDRDRHPGDLLLSGTITDVIDHGTRAAVLFDVCGTMLEASLTPVAMRQLGTEVGRAVEVAISIEDVWVTKR